MGNILTGVFIYQNLHSGDKRFKIRFLYTLILNNVHMVMKDP